MLSHGYFKNHDVAFNFQFLLYNSFSRKTSNIASILHSSAHLRKFFHMSSDLSVTMACQGKQVSPRHHRSHHR